MSLSHWLTMAVQGGMRTIPGRGEGGSRRDEGRGSISRHDENDGRATISRCSLSPLVEVLGLEEFGFES